MRSNVKDPEVVKSHASTWLMSGAVGPTLIGVKSGEALTRENIDFELFGFHIGLLQLHISTKHTIKNAPEQRLVQNTIPCSKKKVKLLQPNHRINHAFDKMEGCQKPNQAHSSILSGTPLFLARNSA